MLFKDFITVIIFVTVSELIHFIQKTKSPKLSLVEETSLQALATIPVAKLQVMMTKEKVRTKEDRQLTHHPRFRPRPVFLPLVGLHIDRVNYFGMKMIPLSILRLPSFPPADDLCFILLNRIRTLFTVSLCPWEEVGP